MRILAIDDNQDNLTALRAVVSDRLPEARVLTAIDGAAGLDLARAADPDVILLDVVMPGMDGYAVCRQLKQDPVLQGIPVLFLTANRTDRASRVKALEAGAEGFLSKPFDDLELTAQIRSMAKIKAAVSAQRTKNERLEALVAERTRELMRELDDRKRAEAALHASEARLRRAQATAHVGDWELDVASQTVRGSLEAFRIHGLEYVADGMSPDLVRGMIDSEDLPRLDASMQALLGTQHPYDVEYRIVRANDGAQRVIHSVASLERDREGTPLRVVGIVQDVTGRRQAEAAVRASEARFRDITSSMGDWVWEIDENNSCTYMSQKGIDFLEKPLEDVLGKTPFDLMSPDEADRVRALCSEIMARKAPMVDLEYWIVRPNGERVCVLTNGFPILDGAGNFRGYRGVNSDITEQKRDERLRQLSSEVLGILNEPIPLADMAQRAVLAIKRETGIEAVGMRLRDGDDFPYFSQNGFPAEFVQAENALVERNENGDVCRDGNGDICLSCTCGLVISGKTDSTGGLFTPGGSCWTNDSSLLLDLSAEEDPRSQPRNRCIHDGYASVALIPIRADQETAGLLHLSDRRRDCFTRRQIEFLEGICASVGIALMRRRAEEEQRRSAADLQRVMDSVSFGVAVIGRDKVIRQVNQAGAEMAGYRSAVALLGATCHEVLCPAESGWCPVLDRGEALDRSERTMRHRSGGTIPILKSVVPIRLAGEDVLLESYVDISELKRSEEQILQQRVSLEKAQELGQIGSWEMDLQQSTLHWSDETYRIFALPPGSVVNYAVFLEKVHPDDRERLARHWRAALDGIPYDIEHRLVVDGAVHWVREKASMEFDESGQAVRALGFTQDITERKRLEERLRQSERMDAIGQLAGGMAHDFNNMLAVILGHTEIAMDSVAPSEPLHANLAEVLTAAKRSADLTRQLLTFARKQVISPEVLDLNEAVTGMLKMLRRLIGENIDLHWKPEEGLWPVMVDPSQIDQVLANLCVNARDAIGDVGTITIRMRNAILAADHHGPHPGEYALLSVSDNGCGMDQQTASQVFEPFFTTKETGKGTGLGLATVYGIVQQNGGRIEISSKPGVGTTFEIYLPRHVGAEPVAAGRMAPPLLGGTETILLVEDELAILKMGKKMLESQGYTVLAAATPREATRLVTARAGKIHLLITDVIMPGMNGQDLATSLISLYPELKCLFMSGYTADIIAHHGVLDDGVHFMQKPFSIKELATKVREALGGSPQAR